MKKRLLCLGFAVSTMVVCAYGASPGFPPLSHVSGFVEQVEDNDVAVVEVVLMDGSAYYVDVAADLLATPLTEGQTVWFYRTGKAYWFANGTPDKSDDFQVLNVGPDGTYSSWHMVVDSCHWYEDKCVIYVDKVEGDSAVFEIIADDGYVYMVQVPVSGFSKPLAAGDKLEAIKYDGSYWYTCGTVDLDDDIEVLGKGEDGFYMSWPGVLDCAPASWFKDFLADRH